MGARLMEFTVYHILHSHSSSILTELPGFPFDGADDCLVSYMSQTFLVPCRFRCPCVSPCAVSLILRYSTKKVIC